MRYFVVEPEGFDIFEVKGETEKEATESFWCKWKEYRRDCEESGYINYEVPAQPEITVREIGQPENRFVPKLRCCKEASKIPKFELDKGPVIGLSAYKFTPDFDSVYECPEWRMKGCNTAISFCPFCGQRLPEVEKIENPPQPIWTPDDGYCGTCHERNGLGCRCNPPECAWKIKE